MTLPLSAQRIAGLRRTGAQQLTIEVVAETGSTNADLLARLDSLASPVLLAAEMQTAGRGRAGRSWHTTPGAALTFSLAWKFDRPLQALAGLPLAVGVAIAETLARFDIDVRLKWPNDVLRDGNKLAGILIETASAKKAHDGGVWAVIGIGINIAIPDSLAATIGRPVADLSGVGMDRDLLLAALLDDLSEALAQFGRAGFSAFADRWNRLHAHAGQQVAIFDHGRISHEGKAIGVDGVGRLLLETAAGEVAITAGDVSLKTVEG
ncbi:MAG: biotin--[acetyl-CoA-carboxylase] ligase [Burkholderiales bacterium RIFCSPLOWO2_02_FULL_57_36]|nr:MAG: biotin--[acetyl-CoA-carboxylase] ligase [Burkholderiales bacterium RIFCSPLOWO2_02_FULL_57_36]